MMRRQIALCAAMGLGFLLTAAGGCGKIDDVAPLDAGADVVSLRDGDGPSHFDGNCCGPPEWEVACFDPTSVLAFNQPPLAPVAHQGKCASDDEVSAFLSACVTNSKGDAGADAGETCEAFVAANHDCAVCLGGGLIIDDAGAAITPWPALQPIDTNGDFLPAVAVCIAAISSGTDTCKSNYANDNLCTQTGCASCSAADFDACATAQTTDPDSTCLIASPLDHDCVAALNAVSQSDADSKCAASTTIKTDTDFDAVFLTVAKTLCETN